MIHQPISLISEAPRPVFMAGVAISFRMAPFIVFDPLGIKDKASIAATFEADFYRVEFARADFKLVRPVFSVFRVSGRFFGSNRS